MTSAQKSTQQNNAHNAPQQHTVMLLILLTAAN